MIPYPERKITVKVSEKCHKSVITSKAIQQNCQKTVYTLYYTIKNLPCKQRRPFFTCFLPIIYKKAPPHSRRALNFIIFLQNCLTLPLGEDIFFFFTVLLSSMCLRVMRTAEITINTAANTAMNLGMKYSYSTPCSTFIS